MINKFNNFFIQCKISLLFLTVFLFFSNGNVLAQEHSKKKIKSLEIRLRLGSVYDSNILKYSEKYLSRFIKHEDEGRFHISTYDDLILYQSLNTSLRFQLFKKRTSKLSLNYTRRAFLKNNIKTWNYFSFGFLQDLSKRAKIKLFYSYIPNYYIRHFRDYDWVDIYGYTPETFQTFSFSKENFEFWIQNTFFTNTKIRLSFQNANYYYNEHFTEYDCTNLSYGIKLYQPVYKKIKLKLGYQLTTSKTKELDDAIYNSCHSDASYNEHEFLSGISSKLPPLGKFQNKFDIYCIYSKRFYTTEKHLEYDQLHAGRIDDNISLYFAYNIKIRRDIELSVFYKRGQRYLNNSTKANKAFLIDEKNFNQFQTGLKLTYNLKFKN